MKLYHYTDAGAVKAILESNEIRLTDMRFMNDSEELTHGTKLVIKEIREGRLHHRLHKDYADIATSYVADELTSLLETGFGKHPIYSCSFSKEGNLLSQWRAYGNYCIEFDSESLEATLTECIYEARVARESMLHSTVEALRGIGRDMRKYDGELRHMGSESYFNLLRLIASIKHPSFSEEQEIRILTDERLSNSLDRNYRVRNDMLIPYVNFSIPFTSISAVNVGPMKYQEMAFDSMSEFVKKVCKMKNLDHEINVMKSEIPYRTA